LLETPHSDRFDLYQPTDDEMKEYIRNSEVNYAVIEHGLNDGNMPYAD
jgi:hypothetical protein